MKLSNFKCVEVNLKLNGWEIEDYIKREIGENTEDWSCYDMELFIYEYIKDLIKGDFGAFEMNTRAVVNKPELGLVSHPMKMEETFHDKLYNLVEPYLDGDFTGYNEEEQAFDIVQAVKEILENE